MVISLSSLSLSSLSLCVCVCVCVCECVSVCVLSEFTHNESISGLQHYFMTKASWFPDLQTRRCEFGICAQDNASVL